MLNNKIVAFDASFVILKCLKPIGKLTSEQERLLFVHALASIDMMVNFEVSKAVSRGGVDLKLLFWQHLSDVAKIDLESEWSNIVDKDHT